MWWIVYYIWQKTLPRKQTLFFFFFLVLLSYKTLYKCIDICHTRKKKYVFTVRQRTNNRADGWRWFIAWNTRTRKTSRVPKSVPFSSSRPRDYRKIKLLVGPGKSPVKLHWVEFGRREESFPVGFRSFAWFSAETVYTFCTARRVCRRVKKIPNWNPSCIIDVTVGRMNVRYIYFIFTKVRSPANAGTDRRGVDTHCWRVRIRSYYQVSQKTPRLLWQGLIVLSIHSSTPK